MITNWRKLRGARTVFKHSYFVKIFQLARAGIGDMDIAKALGVTYVTFVRWRKRKTGVRYALKEGRKDKEPGVKTFIDYIHKRLPEHLRDTWDMIVACDQMETPNAIARLEAMLTDMGKRGRQHLFLHALVHKNFNPSEACRMINIKRVTLDRWVTTDPEFAELINEIDWHKKNYFEGGLIELFNTKDPMIVKFVNETYNADRGYGKKSTVNKNVSVSGTVNTVNSTIPVDEMLKGIPLKDRKKILENMRNAQRNQPKAQEGT